MDKMFKLWPAACLLPLLVIGCGGSADGPGGGDAALRAGTEHPDSLATAAAAAAPPTAILAGEARFQVLSPTLIRTEYAGDRRFVDAATFNAIGRNGFSRPFYTAETRDGWLTVTTAALTLRYRVGSGPFNAQNLTLDLNAGSTPVSARPWGRLPCSAGLRCELENAPGVVLNGVGQASDHGGYSGEGFAAGFDRVGDGAALEMRVDTAGSYQFALQYANGIPGDGQHKPRTLTLSIDGAAQQLTLPTTTDWNTWGTFSAPAVALAAGTHRIALSRGAADTGNLNVDSVALVPAGAGYPAATCRFGGVCQAEDGVTGGSAVVQTDHANYGGRGFVAELNQGASLRTRVIDVPVDGTYALTLRYANGVGGDGRHDTRTAVLAVGSSSQALSFPPTDDWNDWRSVSFTVALKAGANELTLSCPEAASCHVNADTVAVKRAALGGYRRSVDLIDGVAPTTPGLLYQDGWYLLDDSTTALFDTASNTLAARPAHGGQPYQDGYLFAYGQDYKQGLSDLARLTGPSKLLPRWAYGVWYSEYYDRTAADYRDRILPQFRREGVPLDVLVIDTDFKSPSTWNGWQIDTAKFPDPKGFFDWAHGQGLRTTLNIHSSISERDPQFAQAQATAKGKLQRNGCDTCDYIFDWADPDQLKAYFDLHQPMNRQGVDFWWLDLCCDSSQARRTDVTSDAWINQQYAEDANKAVGRGFAFSRTYGTGPFNNQPDVPTGPWADKRTTVHFTGDSYSTWRMLAAEIGYTSAESASTGLSAVSHDIGGFNKVNQAPGAEPGSTRLPDDLYARWVQFGTFQPIDRLHGDHSDRLPWQYGEAAKASAVKFLRLREALVPYTYTLARQAVRSGVPVVRAPYLEYPAEPAAYATAGSQYFFGPDLLVAPITSPGSSASASVWFPAGLWVDFFSGRAFTGGSTQTVAADLNAMPVFLKAGAIVALRGAEVANDAQNPLNRVALTVAAGGSGSFRLYEDNGSTTDLAQSATTDIAYTESAGGHRLAIQPVRGSFDGQVTQRAWQAVFLNAAVPASVALDGTPLPSGAWSYDAASRRLTVNVAQRFVGRTTVISWQ